ncbi:hypothetical protein NC651_007561 [Populus alba x Populus x berolinensis]|nr:hypothetical protein NC651_007561 [Populus alba x Populus x berolinensis]
MARNRGDKEEGPEKLMGLLKLVQILSLLLFLTNNIASAKLSDNNCTVVKPWEKVDFLNMESDSPFYGRMIPSKDVEWGSVSLVDAEKRPF